jgi:hypothetical protein
MVKGVGKALTPRWVFGRKSKSLLVVRGYAHENAGSACTTKKESAVLMTKTVFLKVAGVTPDQLQKLHAFAHYKNLASCLPYQVASATSDVYAFDFGVPCVKVLTSKYEDTDGAYRVEVRVFTAIRVEKYKRIGEPEEALVHESKHGFWITAPSTILDTVLKILDLSPVKESVVEETL